MALFLSTYINKIDKKGRTSVPASFRSVLNHQDFSGIVAYGSFIHPCIEACGMSRIQQLSESIDSLDPYSEERDAFAMAILGGSSQLSFDSEGRVLLPESLLSTAHITDKVAFVGKGQTFELWNPEHFENYATKARDIAKSNRASLRIQPKAGDV